MSDHVRALLAKVLAHLRHAHAQPGLDHAVAAVLHNEIRRLEVIVHRVDAHHVEIASLIEQTRVVQVKRNRQLANAQRTIAHAIDRLSTVPMPSADVVAALDELRAFPVVALPLPAEDEPDPDA